MDKPDKEIFDREVRCIRRTYGCDRKWEDPGRLFAHYLYWDIRELDQADGPDPEHALRELIALSEVNKHMWDAVNLVAQTHLARGDLLPSSLAQWVTQVLRDQYIQPQKWKWRPRPSQGSPSGGARSDDARSD